MKEKKHTILFSLVLLIELAFSLFNFIRYFKIRENNLSAALFSLLHFIPLVVLIALLLVFQTALNYCAVSVWNENNTNATGMQAIGLAFLFFILVAAKILFFLPVLIPAIVGIVKATLSKNKPLKRNDAGLKINIACLAVGVLETFFWW